MLVPHDAHSCSKIERDHTRELERVIQSGDVPTVGLVGYGRNIHTCDILRYSIVLEHRLVVLVVDYRAECAIAVSLEIGVER